MKADAAGNNPLMNETPIFTSVERDLQVSYDDLAAAGAGAPVPETPTAS